MDADPSTGSGILGCCRVAERSRSTLLCHTSGDRPLGPFDWLRDPFRGHFKIPCYIFCMDIQDIYTQMVYDNAAKISSACELEKLDQMLETNFVRNCWLFNDSDGLECSVKETVFEEAVCETFDEETIRKALELGFYPMSLKKRVTRLSELPETELNSRTLDQLMGLEIYRNILTVKYHMNKLIVFPEDLHVTKKMAVWLKGKFAGYTMTFNRDFDLCIEEILNAYPETWLCPELVEKFKLINRNPDHKVSVDSVEIWHDGTLVAGEIGFITGNAYASLSGFHKEDDSGTLQMCALGLYLKENGFAYWDLGMELEYKYRYGATACDREMQMDHWKSLSKKKAEFPKEEIPLALFLEKL